MDDCARRRVPAPCLEALARGLLAVALSAAAASAQGELPSARAALAEPQALGACCVFEGLVLEPGGAPAAGVVVTSSAGGRAVTGADGRYRLESRVPLDAESVQIDATAAGSSARATLSPSFSGAALVAPLALARGSGCTSAWQPTFGGEPGVNSTVLALATFDDGAGPALFAGGVFDSAGGGPVNGLASWDGAGWSAVGSGFGGAAAVNVQALAVLDYGGGPRLVAGGAIYTGTFTFPAAWDGSAWSTFGSGIAGTVLALAAFDDGGGPALYAGGEFLNAGGSAASRVARWDGAGWSALGAGTNGAVRAMAVFDDGGGPALYVAGEFTSAGGGAASRIAKWDGASWSALGSGTSGTVHALAVHAGALYAGGSFGQAGGGVVNRIARWNGSSWSPLASGLNGTVRALASIDDGSGPALHAGGDFMPGRLARWNGSGWTHYGNLGGAPSYGTSNVHALCGAAAGGAVALYAGGSFTTASGAFFNRIAAWTGSAWQKMGGDGPNGAVRALVARDDGGGPALHATGHFTTTGDATASFVARWDGASGSALGAGLPGPALALAMHDDGGGDALYAGGGVNIVQRWNGSTWSRVGTLHGAVFALCVHDDGGGPALYAGGLSSLFQVTGVARWNGSTWTGVGSSMSSGGGILALASFDDGNGAALYAGGDITTVDGQTVNRIARWDGASWSPLGAGMDWVVSALAVFDDGSGPALYAGGDFQTAGGVPASRIARWDGSSWSAVGSGTNGLVLALTAFDDGGGSALYLGGRFTVAGGLAASRVARWDGTGFSALGSGTTGEVNALLGFDDGNGPSLYAGGLFGSAPDSGDSYLARWGCGDTEPPVISCPASVRVADRVGSAPGEVVVFAATASDDLDPAPLVVCVPPSGSLFPPGTTLVTCTATDASGNEAVASFPVVVAPSVRERAP